MNNEGEKDMSQTTVSALGSIAAARTPGTSAMGVGLEARNVHAWFGQKHVLSSLGNYLESYELR